MRDGGAAKPTAQRVRSTIMHHDRIVIRISDVDQRQLGEFRVVFSRRFASRFEPSFKVDNFQDWGRRKKVGPGHLACESHQFWSTPRPRVDRTDSFPLAAGHLAGKVFSTVSLSPESPDPQSVYMCTGSQVCVVFLSC